MRKAIFLVCIAAAGIGLWRFHEPVEAFRRIAESRFLPCTAPIPYALASLDSRFGVSREEFLAAAGEAEALWENAGGKDLFNLEATSTPGSLSLNLIYDERQEATDRLKALGLAIDDSEKTYTMLDENYHTEKSSYDSEKAALDTETASYEKRRNAYEDKVAYWNARGGASGAAYRGLEAERQALNALAADIKAKETALNGLADNINSLVIVLNRIANDLNLTARKYNSESAGQEFEEGLYKTTSLAREIDIYQFENRAKLVRVITHEMGHALGLEHVGDPAAVMYRLNQGQNAALTAADIAELKAHCNVASNK